MVISGLGKCVRGCRCERMERTKVGWADCHKGGEVSGVDEREKESLMWWIFLFFPEGFLVLVAQGLIGDPKVLKCSNFYTDYLAHCFRHTVIFKKLLYKRWLLCCTSAIYAVYQSHAVAGGRSRHGYLLVGPSGSWKHDSEFMNINPTQASDMWGHLYFLYRS